tara:strand:+ start:1975 stop:2217 length:243 start_codon:yes stop_codon:yes gene_type:complete
MKMSKIIFVLAIGAMISVTSCRDTKSKTETTEEHGHEHDSDGNHMNEEKVEQEEFSVTNDSTETKEEIHSHDNGSEHHDH